MIPRVPTKMAVAGRVLGTSSSQVRGIKFYDMSTSSVHMGDNLEFRLEPSNPCVSDYVAVWLPSSLPKMLDHLTREAACCLAPLLRSGLVVTG